VVSLLATAWLVRPSSTTGSKAHRFFYAQVTTTLMKSRSGVLQFKIHTSLFLLQYIHTLHRTKKRPVQSQVRSSKHSAKNLES
jgi:hypothetical protein